MMRLYTFFAVLIIVLGVSTAIADAAKNKQKKRFIVRLEKPSMTAVAAEGVVDARCLRGELSSPGCSDARTYMSNLQSGHDVFLKKLSKLNSLAQVEREFFILFNGLAVSGASRAELESLNGVSKVLETDSIIYEPCLDASLDNISAPVFWESLGGVENAGEGIKIAIIDSGIDIYNPFFDPSGFEMPDGYPKGDIEYTTSKVISARAYFRDNDPVNEEKGEKNPLDHMGHGSHCAGVAAGNYGTSFSLKGLDLEVSGVAPRAYLMNYKVFYNSTSGIEGAMTVELMAAFESAVSDGADVISCSWGGPNGILVDEASAEVYLSAIDAGVVVVFAAGNDGSGPSTIAYPGNLERVITVGAYATGRSFAGYVRVSSQNKVPSNFEKIVAIVGYGSPSFVDNPVGPLPIISAITAGEGLSNDGCSQFPLGSFNESIALITRGECSFSEKISNAYLAGAEAVVIYNDEENALPMKMGGDDVSIPSVQIGNIDGLALQQWVFDNPDTTVSIFDGSFPYIDHTKSEIPANFSGRGPSEAPLLKPEIAAPGINILSATAYIPGESGDFFALMSGTSMATPHVAGAAALLRQLLPEASPDQIKALLIGSARQQFTSMDSTTPLVVGAGFLDLDAASVANVYVSPPVISFGNSIAGDIVEKTVAINDVNDLTSVWEVKWEHEYESFIPVVSPLNGMDVEVPGEFVYSLYGPWWADAGEYTGRLILKKDKQKLVIPYHYRIVPKRNSDVLLLDMSFLPKKDNHLVDLYSQMAEDAGYDYDVFRVSEEEGVPDLALLSSYKTVLVFTGDDQTSFKGWRGMHTMDVLSSYAHMGGGIIVTGQGAFRGSNHVKMSFSLGAAIDETFPLIDPVGGVFYERDNYIISSPDVGIHKMQAVIDLGSDTNGIGDLSLTGEIVPVLGEGMPTNFLNSFLTMKGAPFSNVGGVFGMTLDPYIGYGEDEEIESLKYRTVVLGFGFERVEKDSLLIDARQELFEHLVEWVSERISLNVHVEITGKQVVIESSTLDVIPASIEYDFGDGSKPVVTSEQTVYHKYNEFGVKEITVKATAPLGAVDIWRGKVDLQEEDSVVQEKVTDEQERADIVEDDMSYRVRDCSCSKVGSYGTISIAKLLSRLF